MLKITNFAHSRMNNAEYLAYAINVQKLIVEAGADALGLSADLETKYDAKLTELTDQVYYSRRSPLTAACQDANYNRAQVFRRIRYKLLAVENCVDDPALSACKDVVEASLLTPYTTEILNKPMQEQTAIMTGFIYDLRNLLVTSDRSALGITAEIDELEMENNNFIAAYNERAAFQAKMGILRTQRLRNEMSTIIDVANLQIQLNANDSTCDFYAACVKYVNDINVIIRDVIRRLRQRAAMGNTQGAAEGDNVEPGTTPVTPSDGGSTTPTDPSTGGSTGGGNYNPDDAGSTTPTTPSDGGSTTPGSDSTGGVSDSGNISGGNAEF